MLTHREQCFERVVILDELGLPLIVLVRDVIISYLGQVVYLDFTRMLFLQIILWVRDDLRILVSVLRCGSG